MATDDALGNGSLIELTGHDRCVLRDRCHLRGLSRIGGDVRVSRYDSCWLGLENNHVGGNARFVKNQLADPDAVEIQSNYIRDDLACYGNSMVWDSGDGPSGTLFPRTPAPNTVHGDRAGQCVLASPTSPGGPSGPGPF